MTTRPASARTRPPTTRAWVGWGLTAGLLASAAVVAVQAAAVAAWPEIARFDPLGNYARTVLFTLVPTAIATAVFAWIARRAARPDRAFLILSAVVLIVSFVPDYVLPLPGRTILASSVAALLHVVAAVVVVGVLITGRRRSAAPRRT